MKRRIVNRCIVYEDDNNLYHRLDGPAINWLPNSVYPGCKYWVIHGEFIASNEPNHSVHDGKIVKQISGHEEFLRLLKLRIFW